jgi:hypothetical protein
MKTFSKSTSWATEIHKKLEAGSFTCIATLDPEVTQIEFEHITGQKLYLIPLSIPCYIASLKPPTTSEAV